MPYVQSAWEKVAQAQFDAAYPVYPKSMLGKTGAVYSDDGKRLCWYEITNTDTGAGILRLPHEFGGEVPVPVGYDIENVAYEMLPLSRENGNDPVRTTKAWISGRPSILRAWPKGNEKQK